MFYQTLVRPRTSHACKKGEKHARATHSNKVHLIINYCVRQPFFSYMMQMKYVAKHSKDHGLVPMIPINCQKLCTHVKLPVV